MATAADSLVVDQEFKSAHRTLSTEERSHLEALLSKQGCLDAIKVWEVDGNSIIVDGHNRYEICSELEIPFDVEALEFSDRDAALDWIDCWQLGQRNLSPDDFRIISGRLYNRRKKRHGGDRKSSGQIGHLITDKTRAEVAAELGVGERTIERNGQRAEVYDSILANGDTEAAEIARQAPQKDIAAVKDKPPEIAAAELKARQAVHVSQNTGMPEWYTPSEYIEAARVVMGGIDTDPASSDIAQERVQATQYYTVDDDGLSVDWAGRVWMNPPYTAGLVDKFADKLLEHYNAGDVSQAIVLVNNATDTRWWQRLAANACCVCFPAGRIKFLDQDGKPGAPLQGQSILYLGDDTEAFADNFSQFGVIVEVLAQ